MTTYVLVVAAACLALGGWAFVQSEPGRQVVGAVLGLAVALAVVASIFGEPVTGVQHDILILFAMVLAVAGGGVVTSAVFDTIDSSRSPATTHGRTSGAADIRRRWCGSGRRAARRLRSIGPVRGVESCSP